MTAVVEDKSSVAVVMDEKATTMTTTTMTKTHTKITTRCCSEKPLLDEKVEEEGSAEILKALTEEEKQHLSDEHMPLRHLRAEKGNVKAAIIKCQEAIAWRRDFDVVTIRDCFNNSNDDDDDEKESSAKKEALKKTIAFENATGKVYVRGYTKDGRAAIYLKPGLENSSDEDGQMKHLVYNLERAIACTEKNGKEKYVILIDYDGWSLSKAPSVSATRQTLKILQHHYPERLYRSYILNPPMLFRGFWSLTKPFIDPITKQKIQFCTGKSGKSILENDFDLNTLESCAYGTTPQTPFDSKTYLSAPSHLTYDETNTPK